MEYTHWHKCEVSYKQGTARKLSCIKTVKVMLYEIILCAKTCCAARFHYLRQRKVSKGYQLKRQIFCFFSGNLIPMAGPKVFNLEQLERHAFLFQINASLQTKLEVFVIN